MENTTPVPNAVFDRFLKELKCAELKILLIIIRQTLGWSDLESGSGRKESDWISGSQLREKTGCSPRAITIATENLIRKKLIAVSDQRGIYLHDPDRRKGKLKLFYRPASAIFAVVNTEGKTSEEACFTRNASADYAGNISRKCAELAQKMRITKETLTKETLTKETSTKDINTNSNRK